MPEAGHPSLLLLRLLFTERFLCSRHYYHYFIMFFLSLQAVNWKYCHTHFTDEETEVQKGFMICEGSLASQWSTLSTPSSYSHIYSACLPSPRQPSFTKSNQRCSLFPSHVLLNKASCAGYL